jgi:L-alanine-DL-glutamate epimerase-like enolase superfamily enzyme
MKINILKSYRLHIPFVTAFKHASAQRSKSYSFWVEAHSDNYTGYGEGCPRAYVTSEDLDSSEDFLQQVENKLCTEIVDLISLQQWVAHNQTLIDCNPAAWCAIELALLDLIAKESTQTVESLLGLPALSGCFRYSAVLGASSTDAFTKQLKQYIGMGFTDFKVKLSGDFEQDNKHLSLVSELLTSSGRIRVDANNLWNQSDEAINYLKALNTQLFAIEEPINAFDFSGLTNIAKSLNCSIILDESFLNVSHFDFIKNNPERWIINLRISKMGGLLRSLACVEQAKKYGIKIIIGAQVGETSLLTRAALAIAQIAKPILIAQEGAFGTLLLQQDVCTPPLMFRDCGIVKIKSQLSTNRMGFGLIFSRPRSLSTK